MKNICDLEFSIPRRLALLALIAPALSRAQELLPRRAVRSLIVPLAPGSVSDILARLLAERLAAETGSPFIVENLAGAGGALAGRQIMRRPRDGSAVLLATSGLICNLPALSQIPLDFDPRTDFKPVCIFGTTPFVLVASPRFPASNLRELQKVLKAGERSATFAIPFIGSANHIAAALLLERMGLDGTTVPYRNPQQGLIEVMEDQVSFAVFAAGFVATHLASGRVKGLALLGAEPEGTTLGVAGLSAQGFGELEVQGWTGLFVGKGVPAPVVDEYESLVRAYVHSPEGRAAMRRNWQSVEFFGSAQAETIVARDGERYRDIFRRLKIG